MNIGIAFQCANIFPVVEKARAKNSVSIDSDIFVEIFFPGSRIFLPVGVLGTSLQILHN